MKPKYRQSVCNLLNYYISQGYNDFNLKVFVNNYTVYNGYLECYTGEALGYDILEFFCDRRNREIRVYVEE